MGVTVRVAFLWNHFSGKVPFTVTGIWFPTVSSGVGVTLKLFCESGLSLLLQEVVNNTTAAANKKDKRRDFLFIWIKFNMNLIDQFSNEL
jgi:hypothetical protein